MTDIFEKAREVFCSLDEKKEVTLMIGGKEVEVFECPPLFEKYPLQGNAIFSCEGKWWCVLIVENLDL